MTVSMKITLPLCVVLWSLLVGSVSRSQNDAASNPNPEQEAPDPRYLEKNGLQIVSAIYGSGTAFSDVTDEATSLLNNQTKFYARPEWLRVDPTPGWNKALVIVFVFEGHRYIFTCGEAGEVRIPLLKRVASEQAASADTGGPKN